MLSLYNLQTLGITTPNIVVGMAVFCGGLAQLLAGMWEFPKGNIFGATGEPPSKDLHWMKLSPDYSIRCHPNPLTFCYSVANLAFLKFF